MEKRWPAILCFLLIFLGSPSSCASKSKGFSPWRIPRRIIGYLTSSSNLGAVEYPFCNVNNITAACVEDVVCAAEKGLFLGYCGYADGVCCDVIKTCGASTSAHAVRFQNPSFPKSDTEGRTCTLTLSIGRGICALRMDNEVFELHKYNSDYCPVDTLTLLGTKSVTSPLCGNMTGWATTFEVEEYTTITLAMALQGTPPYRFSTQLTMLPCDDIIPLRSPLNAGMKNVDAQKYVPITVTEAAPTTTEDTTTEDTTTEDPMTTDMTTETLSEQTTTSYENFTNVVVRDSDNEIVTSNPTESDSSTTATTTTTTPAGPTPLPTGTFSPVKSTTSVIEVKMLQREKEGQSDFVDGAYDPTPNSIFKKIFDSKVVNKCWQHEEPIEIVEDFGVESEISFRNAERDKCWVYDPLTGNYKVNDQCLSDYVNEPKDGGFRIIGGRLTNINEYPWQVGLIYKSKFFCGGTLISDRHILTAAHCVFGSFSSGINHLKVTLGDHDLRTKAEVNNTLLGVRRVIWHVHYSPDTTKNDIAILELEKPVVFSYGILPANLPTDLDDDFTGHNATVTGWGRNSVSSKRTSTILKEYTSPIDDISTCVKRWDAYPSISASEGIHICLNVTYGTPCHGDSGGPLVACNNGARCTIIGVVSFGFPLCRNVGLPAVFTRVTSFKRWIDINTTPLFYK